MFFYILNVATFGKTETLVASFFPTKMTDFNFENV